MNDGLALHDMSLCDADSQIVNFIHGDLGQKKELFLVLSSVDIAFQFAYNLINRNIKVNIEHSAEKAFKECGVTPYDVIEMNESFSAETIMDIISENRKTWSKITILLAA